MHSTLLIDTYRAPIRLIVTGSGEIASTEGTTQGDPLAMAMYALAITPLIHQLSSRCSGVQQVWFADDATGASTCTNLKSWWNELSRQGPAFGYYPNRSKTYLVIKQEHETSARQLFDDTEKFRGVASLFPRCPETPLSQKGEGLSQFKV